MTIYDISEKAGVSIATVSRVLNGNTNVFPVEDADTSIAYVMAWGKNISNPAAKLFVEAVKKYATGDDNVYGL